MKRALLLTMFGLLQIACVSEATSDTDDDDEVETTAPTVDVTKNLNPTANTVFTKPVKTSGGLAN